jgi:malate dehydrogenase (oxaloacetate-decarboxylating)
MDEWEVFPREAVAVGTKAIEQGVARFNFPADVRFKMAEETIRASRDEVQRKMKEGIIVDPDN